MILNKVKHFKTVIGRHCIPHGPALDTEVENTWKYPDLLNDNSLVVIRMYSMTIQYISSDFLVGWYFTNVMRSQKILRENDTELWDYYTPSNWHRPR